MRVVVVASGSKGNALVIESQSGDTRLLIDAGIGLGALTEKVERAGLGGMPNAILITHSHNDHVGCARRLSRKLGASIHATVATATAAGFDPKRVLAFHPREPFSIGSLRLHPIPIPHDAPQVALRIEDGKTHIAIATDLGDAPARFVEHVRDVDALFLESNYDPRLLAEGPYHPAVKRRVASPLGHLSNSQCASVLERISGRVATVVLMHLSETNNTPDLALESARAALTGRRIRLLTASQDDCLVIEPAEPPSLALAPLVGSVSAAGSAMPRKHRAGAVLPGQLSLF